MTDTIDPRGYMHWIVWARKHGETAWIAPMATYDQPDAWSFARIAIESQEGQWEFTVRHLNDGPPDY